jgi:protein-S-isoprenylcysteine O-methyltransferase Ste14
MNKAFWTTLTFSLGYLALSLLCLVGWGSSTPLARLDRYSVTYLCIRLLGSLHSLISSRAVFRSKRAMLQWWALDSDPSGPVQVMFLMAADLAIFLDYGHWHLVSGLEQPLLQSLGLALYVVSTTWQIWTDNCLATYFGQNNTEPVPMDHGPFRYVRHPRYAAAIVSKIAVALVFASIVGWTLAAAWAYLLMRKIEIEEAHLQSVFGTTYEAYSQKTARILPGIY